MSSSTKPLDRKIYDHFEENGFRNLISFATLIGTFVFFNGCLQNCKTELANCKNILIVSQNSLNDCIKDKRMIDSKFRDCLNGKGFITSRECLTLVTDQLADYDRKNVFDCIESYQ